ncbi:MAG: hypothetical protein PHH07_06825 [Candidatus Cloacimonetes bacterium]|nr:hypothetical protein [Candidatus Cloacimonadota bacterium]
MNNVTDSDAKPTRLAATAQIKFFFQRGSFNRADLVLTDDGYELRLHTEKEILVVARRTRDKPRSWQSVDRALNYVQEHFGSLGLIHLNLSPSNKELQQ